MLQERMARLERMRAQGMERLRGNDGPAVRHQKMLSETEKRTMVDRYVNRILGHNQGAPHSARGGSAKMPGMRESHTLFSHDARAPSTVGVSLDGTGLNILGDPALNGSGSLMAWSGPPTSRSALHSLKPGTVADASAPVEGYDRASCGSKDTALNSGQPRFHRFRDTETTSTFGGASYATSSHVFDATSTVDQSFQPTVQQSVRSVAGLEDSEGTTADQPADRAMGSAPPASRFIPNEAADVGNSDQVLVTFTRERRGKGKSGTGSTTSGSKSDRKDKPLYCMKDQAVNTFLSVAGGTGKTKGVVHVFNPRTGAKIPLEHPAPGHIDPSPLGDERLIKPPPDLLDRISARVEGRGSFTPIKVFDSNYDLPRGSNALSGSTLPQYYTSRGRGDTVLGFESRFECGNLQKATMVGPYEYDLTLRCDYNTTRHTQWFYFRFNNTVKGGTYTFNITNLRKASSLYNQGMQPLIYSDKLSASKKLGWHRTGADILYASNNSCSGRSRRRNSLYTLTFTITVQHGGDTCYLAHCYPYSYTQLERYLTKLEKDVARSQYVKRSSLCNTLAGNSCDCLTITAFSDPESTHSPRKGVVLTARVHPGETNASWMMQGVVDFLTGPSAEAARLRSKFVFKIVPMLNPDGVICGNYRCSLAGIDLNRHWLDPSKTRAPTIHFTKAMIHKFANERELVLFTDFHGHSRKKNIFMYGCNNSSIAALDRQERIFPHMLHSRKCAFNFNDCNFAIQRGKDSTARVVFWREIHLIQSYTMEASFAGADRGPLKGLHFNTRHLLKMGEDFSLSLFDLCCSDGSRVSASWNTLTRMAESGGGYDEESAGSDDASSGDEDDAVFAGVTLPTASKGKPRRAHSSRRRRTQKEVKAFKVDEPSGDMGGLLSSSTEDDERPDNTMLVPVEDTPRVPSELGPRLATSLSSTDDTERSDADTDTEESTDAHGAAATAYDPVTAAATQLPEFDHNQMAVSSANPRVEHGDGSHVGAGVTDIVSKSRQRIFTGGKSSDNLYRSFRGGDKAAWRSVLSRPLSEDASDSDEDRIGQKPQYSENRPENDSTQSDQSDHYVHEAQLSHGPQTVGSGVTDRAKYSSTSYTNVSTSRTQPFPSAPAYADTRRAPQRQWSVGQVPVLSEALCDDADRLAVTNDLRPVGQMAYDAASFTRPLAHDDTGLPYHHSEPNTNADASTNQIGRRHVRQQQVMMEQQVTMPRTKISSGVMAPAEEWFDFDPVSDKRGNYPIAAIPKHARSTMSGLADFTDKAGIPRHSLLTSHGPSLQPSQQLGGAGIATDAMDTPVSAYEDDTAATSGSKTLALSRAESIFNAVMNQQHSGEELGQSHRGRPTQRKDGRHASPSTRASRVIARALQSATQQKSKGRRL